MAKKTPPAPFLDRVLAAVSPARALERERARLKLDIARKVRAEYDGATVGRRSTGWRRSHRHANGELNGRVLQLLRASSRDLVRNNPHGARAVSAWADHIVGAGIEFQILRNGAVDDRLTEIAMAHMHSTAVDAEGHQTLFGLQHLAARTIVESGAVLVRRRWRRAADRLPLPFQLQLLEPDYLDPGKDGPAANGELVSGIEFDALGRRRGYWLYSRSPGAARGGLTGSKFVPASEVAHCYRRDRPEQQNGAPWLAPVILRMNDYSDLEDAYLMRQKIASAFSVFVSGDPEVGLGQQQAAIEAGNDERLEMLEPGIIEYLAEGQNVTFANPPSVEGYGDFAKISLHAIAVGADLPYELMTGNYSEVTFISGRLARLAFARALAQRQWEMFIPQFCHSAGRWLIEGFDMAGEDVRGLRVDWTPPPLEMTSPETELPAKRDAIRSGMMNLSGVLREYGVNPSRHFAERAADNAALDENGIVVDSDPRKVTAVGNAVGTGATTIAPLDVNA